jgi:hypothetical protein
VDRSRSHKYKRQSGRVAALHCRGCALSSNCVCTDHPRQSLLPPWSPPWDTQQPPDQQAQPVPQRPLHLQHAAALAPCQSAAHQHGSQTTNGWWGTTAAATADCRCRRLDGSRLPLPAGLLPPLLPPGSGPRLRPSLHRPGPSTGPPHYCTRSMAEPQHHLQWQPVCQQMVNSICS